MPKILITGFGPFPGARDNPSAQVVEHLASAHHRSGWRVIPAVLPTSWRQVEPELARLITRYNPVCALHLGYFNQSPGFQLEQSARNQTCAEADHEGFCEQIGPVCAGQPAQLHTPYNTAELVADLQGAGLAAQCSSDAGRYLCNKLYYLSLSQLKSALFVHIPALQSAQGVVPASHDGVRALLLEDAIKGIDLLANALLSAPEPI